jgi:hypothetical protein
VNNIDEYANAVCAHRNGDPVLAAELLSRAIGLGQPTELIRRSITQLMDDNTPIHQALTELVVLEQKKVRNGK